MQRQDRRDDFDVVKEGRRGTLKDTADLQVTVPLRDQIVQKLVRELESRGEGMRTKELWTQGNTERSAWLTTQQEMLQHFDEFVDPIYTATQDWSSTLHLPTILTFCKTYHARMLAALLSIDPPFSMKARQSAHTDRVPVAEGVMRYVLKDYANCYQGIDDVVDDWLWSWITQGQGVLKNRWETKFTKYVDVVERDVVVGAVSTTDEAGNVITLPQTKKVEEEQEVVIKTFDGPMIEHIPNEDVLILGGSDAQEADHVLHSYRWTASQLWTLVDRGVFRQEAVENIIKAGESLLSKDANNAIKEQQSASSGQAGVDSTLDEKRYQIIERHSRIVVDDSGIASDVIMFVSGETGDICRATYLYRVSKAGLRPFFPISFYRRANGNPAGLPELLYSLAKEIDAIHNMRVDFGLISSMPFGFYRASSSMSEERIPFEPGMMIPLDNPQTDVFFPNLGSRTGFTEREEAALMQNLERLTSISDLSLGIVGGQGAARTATGARALLGEANASLDVYLRRMNRGWKRMLTHLFHMLQEKLPDGFEYRILGDDGNQIWGRVQTRAELAGMYDISLESNSANSNKQVQIETAASILTTIANPFYIQLGIVGPAQLFNALKNLFSAQGVTDFSKYIAKPQGPLRVYSPEEIANATLAGVDIKLGPEQDLSAFIAYWDYIEAHDEILGQFDENQVVTLFRKVNEAKQMLSAMQAQQAQVANQQQISTNAAMSMGPQAQPQGAVQAPAAVAAE